MFNAPSHIAWMRDCVNGGPNCNTTTNPGYDPSDFTWNIRVRGYNVPAGNQVVYWAAHIENN